VNHRIINIKLLQNTLFKLELAKSFPYQKNLLQSHFIKFAYFISIFYFIDFAFDHSLLCIFFIWSPIIFYEVFYIHNFLLIQLYYFFFNAHANCPSVYLSEMFLITRQSYWILFRYLNSSHARQIWETCSYFKDLLLLTFVQLLVLPWRNTGADSRTTFLIFKLSICRMPKRLT
jgi:hypothetical protein